LERGRGSTTHFDGFDWDDGNLGKALRHGITDEEIEQVFFNHPIPDRQAHNSPTEHRWRALGETDDGRRLRVIFTFRTYNSERLVRPITALVMDQVQRRLYERRKSR
jgi:uncharacterized DUF497 family protein